MEKKMEKTWNLDYIGFGIVELRVIWRVSGV